MKIPKTPRLFKGITKTIFKNKKYFKDLHHMSSRLIIKLYSSLNSVIYNNNVMETMKIDPSPIYDPSVFHTDRNVIEWGEG